MIIFSLTNKSRWNRMAKIKRKYMEHSGDKEAKQKKNKCDCYIDSSQITIERTSTCANMSYAKRYSKRNVVELNRTIACHFYAVIIPQQILLFNKRHSIYCRLLSLYKMHSTISKVCTVTWWCWRAQTRSHTTTYIHPCSTISNMCLGRAIVISFYW